MEQEFEERVADLEESYAQRVRNDALRAADALNRMFAPAIRAYCEEMQRLANVAGQALYTCIPGDGTVCIGPESNEAAPDTPAPAVNEKVKRDAER